MTKKTRNRLLVLTIVLAVIVAIGGLMIWIVIFRIARPLKRITGTMTEHDYRHHHELEYDEVKSDPDRVVQPHHEESDSPSDGS